MELATQYSQLKKQEEGSKMHETDSDKTRKNLD